MGRRRAREACPRGNGKRVPRGGNGAGPPTRSRDGFLLGGRNDGWGVVVPAELVLVETGSGYPEGGMGRGLPRAPGMDSCSGAGMTVGAPSCPRTRVPRGGNGAGPPPRAPGMDSCSGAGMTVAGGRPVRGERVEPCERGQPGFRRGGSRTAPTSHRPFVAPSTSSEPAPYLIRGRTEWGARSW